MTILLVYLILFRFYLWYNDDLSPEVLMHNQSPLMNFPLDTAQIIYHTYLGLLVCVILTYVYWSNLELWYCLTFNPKTLNQSSLFIRFPNQTRTVSPKIGMREECNTTKGPHIVVSEPCCHSRIEDIVMWSPLHYFSAAKSVDEGLYLEGVLPNSHPFIPLKPFQYFHWDEKGSFTLYSFQFDLGPKIEPLASNHSIQRSCSQVLVSTFSLHLGL